MQSWTRRTLLMAAAGYWLAGCSHASAGGVPYSVGVSGNDNLVSIAQDAGGGTQAYVVTIQSESGIGQATVAWWGATAPHHLAFSLALRGLEHFSLMWAGKLVTLAINSSNGAALQTLHEGAGSDEVSVTADSPYWMAVTLPSSARPSYLVTAPSAFVADAPRLWAMAWIDFYR